MRGIAVIAVLMLTGCGQGAPAATTSAPTAPQVAAVAAPPAPAFELSCAAFADATAASLGQRFGESNISVQTLPGPEGENYQATVVFADDPSRRIEITWNDATDHPSSVTVSGASSQWKGPADLMLGQSVSDVEHANGGAFSMSGFGWDYGGYVINWRDGALAHQPCHVALRFDEPAPSNSAIGDGEFASNSAAIRAAHAVVQSVALNFPDD